MTIVEMSVHMDCGGCQSRIRKALQKLEGVDEIDIDMERQKVTVTGYVDQKKVLKTVRKTGRRAVLWPYPYVPEYTTNAQHYNQYYYQHQPSHAHRHVAAAAFASDPYYCSSSLSSSSSSYNYNMHGYDDSSMYGYYQRPAYSALINERASDMFSDDNPNACSVM